MRIRPLAALSVAALSVLVLAGCASSEPEAASTPTATTEAADLCSVASPTGDVVEAVTVDETVGSAPTVEFTAPLAFDSAERRVAVEGTGTQIADGDYVSYGLAVFDATTGDLVQQAGFDGESLPAIPITVGGGPDVFFGCATEGSRILMTVPASQSGNAQVYVIDVLGVTAADQWCVATEPSGEFPTVEFDADGAPTISVPAADAPDGVQIEVLEEGDGDVVQPGDSVTVNYTGVRWSDGTVFDSSWENGSPATFPTTGVVTGFQRALEGQAVGSKVLVSMSPACGYGDGEVNADDLTGETLVFVVEIIETTAG